MIEIEPGRIVTGSYLVTNGAHREQRVLESLVLPAGWQPVIDGEQTIILGAREQQIRLVAFVVPRSCRSGRYEIGYSLVDQNSTVQAIESFSVLVLPVIKLDFMVEESPRLVLAGDDYEVRTRLVNKGNSTTSIALKTTGSPDYPVRLDAADIILPAGSSKLISLFVTTDAGLEKRTSHVLQIEAEANGADGRSVSAERTVLVEVLPKLAAVIDLYHRVPNQVRFVAVGDNSENGAQVEYSGSGSLDEEGNRKIDFLFRGPDVQDQSIYGTRDALRFNYADQLLEISAGDRGYSLSPLAERFNYGRGVEARVKPRGFELGSFYVETRWGTPRETEIGAYGSYAFGNKLRVKGNFLKKRQDEGPTIDSYEADIYTVQANINAGARLDVGLEYGYSIGDIDGAENDFAHRLTLNGRLSSRCSYILENVYATPGFLGYYRDALYSSGTVTFPVYRGLRGNLSYHAYENNLNLDPTKDTAPRERIYRGVLSYPFSSGTSVSLDYEAARKRDDLSPAQHDFEDSIWRLGLGQTLDKLGVQTYSERVIRRNNLPGVADETSENFSIYAYLRPSTRQTLTVYTKVGSAGSTGRQEKATSVGASASIRLLDVVGLRFSYQKNDVDNELRPWQESFFSTVDIQLPNAHSLTFRARRLRFENRSEDDYAFLAAYTIPFNIPASRKKGFGVLKGRVFDGDKAGSPPLANVMLSSGGVSAVTNDRGEFAFPTLKPGFHSVWIDQRSIGFTRTASASNPMVVEIGGGETMVENIGVVTTCRISGTVATYALSSVEKPADQTPSSPQGRFIIGMEHTKDRPIDQGDLAESGRLSNVLVELSNGTETLRQLTDEAGRFSFDRIRPGEWRLHVYDQDLPLHHYVENANVRIGIDSGEEKVIAVRVLPRLRSIRMMDTGD